MNRFKKFFLKILVHTCIAVLAVEGFLKSNGHKSHNNMQESEPEFLAPLENLTATQGRDVSFTCVVNELGGYRVAWIKSDSKEILAIHTHMVALKQRLSVTHNGHNTWKLHISHVQLNDSGSYMCQVNTDPMRSQSGFLDVVVPPDILNQRDLNSAVLEEGVVSEGGTVQLMCMATGVPEPNVQWKREGGKDIVLRTEGRERQVVKHIDGERLVLQQVQRTDMGGYLCIASNGVPPSMSKRFDVEVHFKPLVKAVNQLLGAPVESHVLLECIAEAFPRPLNGWYKNEAIKLYDGQKYAIEERMINSYTWQLNLTVKNLQKSDFAAYSCASENALGKMDARIRLQELRLPPKPTTTPTPRVYYTTAKPRRKQHQNHNSKGGLLEVAKIKETPMTNHMLENDIVGQVEAQTQSPGRGNLEKTRDTQTPAAGPSQIPPWIHQSNKASATVSHYHVGVRKLAVASLFIILVFLH